MKISGAGSSAKGADITVWVVEDNAAFRSALVMVLDKAPGIKCVFEAGSAEEAMQAIRKKPHPNVILMDIELPGISGIEALSRIKPQLPGTSAVIVTAFYDDDRIFRAILAGASGYLLKSASMAEIIGSVRDAATGGAPMTPLIAKAVLGLVAGSAKNAGKDYGLSPSEKEILELMTKGLLKKEISDKLSMSYHTVDARLRSIYSKLHVNTRSEAVGKALREGVVS